jgi:hypothetical protein
MIHVERGPAPPDFARRASVALKKLSNFFDRVLGQIERVVENYKDWRVARRSPERRRRLSREWDELENFLMPDAPYLCLTKQLITRKVDAPMRMDIERLRQAR